MEAFNTPATPVVSLAENDLGSSKAKEEQEFQKLYTENQNQIKARTEVYWDITRGTSSQDPTLLNYLRAINGRIEDIQSRLKDSQRAPSNSRGTGIVNLEVNSPFAGRRTTIGLRHGGTVLPGRVNARPFDIARHGKTDFPNEVRHPKRGFDTQLPDYTYTEKELSTMRSQLNLLYEERERLVQGMREKEVFAGSVPFEAYP